MFACCTCRFHPQREAPFGRLRKAREAEGRHRRWVWQCRETENEKRGWDRFKPGDKSRWRRHWDAHCFYSLFMCFYVFQTLYWIDSYSQLLSCSSIISLKVFPVPPAASLCLAFRFFQNKYAEFCAGSLVSEYSLDVASGCGMPSSSGVGGGEGDNVLVGVPLV